MTLLSDRRNAATRADINALNRRIEMLEDRLKTSVETDVRELKDKFFDLETRRRIWIYYTSLVIITAVAVVLKFV